jgi:starch phosphorylase
MNFKKFFVYPRIPENLQKLLALSNNLWFTWNYDALSLFYKIDAETFRRFKYNAKKFFYHLPKTKLQKLEKEERFLMDLEDIWEAFEEYKEYKHPLIENMDIKKEDIIAYFSTEFGFHPVLPIYAGGLGVLAGDMIIGASDLGLPLIGIGLLYKNGYFRQKIDPAIKTQVEEPDEVDVFLNFLQEVKNEKGESLVINLEILDVPVKIKVWKLDVGRTFCYFLDTDIFENPPEIRDILRYLYPGEPERRIQQEIILGLGGYYALKAMGIKPKLYHLNEGHSAFVIFARLKDLIKEEGLSLDEAKMFIKETTIFTTHTPVISGNEHFPHELVKKYLFDLLEDVLDLKTREKLFEEGFIGKDKTVFWLPALAIRNASYVNAVSKLHQNTTKRMWNPLFEKHISEEVPIDYVTNGVHWRWLSEPFYNLLKKYLGPHFIYMSPDDSGWEEILKIPDEEVWDAHKRNKYRLVGYLKKLLEEEYLKLNLPLKETRAFKFPKADNLIITCARRITGYKRNTLILYDKEKIAEILKNTDTILLFAGKAHPKDEDGKKMIREILEFREQYGLYDKVIFLENYDIHLARYLVWGSDVWLNTPFRPFEASGTSGIKASMNGVLHLSVLDGWWPEGYTGNNGWAIYPKEGLPPYNSFEANQIYNILENEIQPLYYERDEEGIPRNWIKMMKQAIYTACKDFSINRALIEYTKKFYIPALDNFKILTENNYAFLHEIINKKNTILEKWDELKILNVYDNIFRRDLFEDDKFEITVEVELAGLSPDLIDVQIVFLSEIYCVLAPGVEEEIKRILEVISIPFKEYKDNKAIFHGIYPLYGHGLKQYSLRIVPKNAFIRRSHPELIKWKN